MIRWTSLKKYGINVLGIIMLIGRGQWGGGGGGVGTAQKERKKKEKKKGPSMHTFAVQGFGWLGLGFSVN